MEKTSNINFKFYTCLKTELEKTCSDMGIMITAVFMRLSSTFFRKRRIPFQDLHDCQLIKSMSCLR